MGTVTAMTMTTRMATVTATTTTTTIMIMTTAIPTSITTMRRDSRMRRSRSAPSLLRLSMPARLGVAAVAVVLLWAGILLAMR